MKRDPDVINAAVLESACVIQLVPKDLITRELALEALLSWEIHAFEHIPERLVDYDLIYEACTINGMVLLFAPEEFRNDVPLQAAALHSIWDNPRYITKNGVEKASIPVVDYWILFHSVKKIMLDWPICKTICHKSGHA